MTSRREVWLATGAEIADWNLKEYQRGWHPRIDDNPSNNGRNHAIMSA
jgi:hypothetical protein